MNIVVLDGYALNPGDLSWEGLDALGEVTRYDHSQQEEVVSRLQKADIAVVNKVLMTQEVLQALPQLKAIVLTATGYNNVDLSEATKQGITVHNVPAYSTDSVVQLIFSFILHFARQVPLHHASVQAGEWEKSTTFCYWKSSQMELQGKILGIFGYGSIGQATAKIAQAFGMTVYVATRTPCEDQSVTFVSPDKLRQESDFVVLACALTDATFHLVSDQFLSQMKPTAFLINTGRGPLVDEEALASALERGILAGAAVDVLTEEPPRGGSPLINAPRCIITPHIGWATVEARQRCMAVTIANVQGVVNGKMVNAVNYPNT